MDKRTWFDSELALLSIAKRVDFINVAQCAYSLCSLQGTIPYHLMTSIFIEECTNPAYLFLCTLKPRYNEPRYSEENIAPFLRIY